MKKLIAGMAAVLLLAGISFVWAEEASAPKEKPQTPAARPHTPQLKESPDSVRVRGPLDPSQRTAGQMGGAQDVYKEMLKQKEQLHQQGIQELEAIKKIAESENATKTIEALRQLIEKKNADFKQQTADAEKKRAEIMERMRQRQQGGAMPQAPGTGGPRPSLRAVPENQNTKTETPKDKPKEPAQ